MIEKIVEKHFIAFACALMLSNPIELNQSVLFKTFGHSHDSIYIDLLSKLTTYDQLRKYMFKYVYFTKRLNTRLLA